MIVLDTDIFSLLAARHSKVAARFSAAADVVTITLATRIEVLQGRFAFLFKAANGAELLRAQEWLRRTESDLAPFTPVRFNDAAAAEFDRLRGTKGLRRIGRGDHLIASIALANKATLVTRNLKDFRKIQGLQIENWAD